MAGKPKGRSVKQKPIFNEEVAKQMKFLLDTLPISYALDRKTQKAVKYISALADWRTDEQVVKFLKEKTEKIQEFKRNKKLLS